MYVLGFAAAAITAVVTWVRWTRRNVSPAERTKAKTKRDLRLNCSAADDAYEMATQCSPQAWENRQHYAQKTLLDMATSTKAPLKKFGVYMFLMHCRVAMSGARDQLSAASITWKVAEAVNQLDYPAWVKFEMMQYFRRAWYKCVPDSEQNSLIGETIREEAAAVGDDYFQNGTPARA